MFFSVRFLLHSLQIVHPNSQIGWVDQLQISRLAVAAVVVNCLPSRVKIAHVTSLAWEEGHTEGREWRLIALGQQTLLLHDCRPGLVSFSCLNRMQFTIILLKVRYWPRPSVGFALLGG